MLNSVQINCAAVICSALLVGTAEAQSAQPEFSDESAALIQATTALFDSVEAGDEPRSKAPIIEVPFKLVRSSVQPGKAEALTRNGPVRHLTGYNITWYPTDRLLGVVDFMGTWDGNRNLVCGYLTWDMSQADEPVLQNVSVSFVDVSQLARADAMEVEIDLLTANCAFTEIEQNYHFFDVSG